MASVKEVKNKDGTISYKVTVSLGRTESGKQVLKYKTFKPDPDKTKKQNEKALDKFIHDFEESCKSGSIEGERRTFENYARNWLKNYAEVELEKTTVSRYRSGLENTIFPRIGHMKIADIKPSTIQWMLNDMRDTGFVHNGKRKQYSDESCRTIKIIVSSIMSSALGDGLISQNPCIIRQRNHKKVERKEIQCFSIEQAVKFLDVIENPIPIIVPAKKVIRHGKEVDRKEYQQGELVVALKYKVAYTVTIFSGVRREELLGLQWRDVDFVNHKIDINKAVQYTKEDGIFVKTPKSSAGYREIYLPDTCMKLLHELKRFQNREIFKQGSNWKGSRKIEENFCFTQDDGKIMFPSTLRAELVRILKTYNKSCKNENDKLPVISFHDLRHTSASILMAQGLEPTAIAERLGHSDASITLQVYAHSFAERDKAAANALEEALIRKA